MFETHIQKKIIVIIMLYWGASYTAQAQIKMNTKVDVILKIYQQVRAGISQKKLYSNNYTINLKRHNLNHSGYNHYSEKFYYSFAKSKPILRLALVRREKENIDYQKEFLFSPAGELVYFHEKQNDVKKYPYRELKVYFEQGKLLVWNQNKQSIMQSHKVQSPNEKIDLILKEAAELQERLKNQLRIIELREIP